METIIHLTSVFTNPFLSSLENRRQPKNITAILNLFRETSRFKVFDMRDHELLQHYDVYA